MAFDPQMFGSGVGGMFGGLFGNSGKPYDKAMQQYQNWFQPAAANQSPYQNAGLGGINNFQEWLSSQKDPAQFINSLMGQYQESPYNQFLKNQSMLAGQNAGSADGTLGSTPMMQQMQQNAANISQGGLNDWLKNVLGINQQYGAGQKSLIDTGQNSANSLSNLYNQMGNRMGEAAYGKEAGKNQDFWNTVGGIGSIFGSLFGH
jgi:hypothetical protein